MPEPPKIDIRPDHWEIVRGILRKHVPQHEVWAFGSRAKWTAKAHSDLDLAVIGDKPLSLDVGASLSDDFSESDLPYRVDVVDWATTGDAFRKIIERDRVVVQRGGRSWGTVPGQTWTEAALGEVLELKRGYDLPKERRTPGYVPIVSSSGVTDFHSEAMVKGPGVVTGRYGTIGEVFYVAGDFWPLNTTLYVKDFKGNDPRFISYFLKTLDFKAYSDKGAVPGLNRNHLHLARVRIPDLRAQRAIAHVLSTLDAKIDINRRINQTLEAMAQAIFKSWFVDFDPVKAKIAAKAEGRDPLRAAMSAISGKTYAELDTLPPDQFATLAATAALFPDEMADAELEEIPKGWVNSTLGDLCMANGGLIQTGPFGSQLHARDYTTEGVPVVMPQDISCRRISTEKIARIAEVDAERLRRHRMQAGDIVFSRRGDVGRHALVTPRESGWLCGTGCLLVRPSTGARISAYVSCTLAQAEARAWLARHAVGATMPNLNTTILSNLPIVRAPSAVTSEFQEQVGAMEAAMSASIAEVGTLSEARDALLPRLLSGELQVHEPEREAAV